LDRCRPAPGFPGPSRGSPPPQLVCPGQIVPPYPCPGSIKISISVKKAVRPNTHGRFVSTYVREHGRFGGPPKWSTRRELPPSALRAPAIGSSPRGSPPTPRSPPSCPSSSNAWPMPQKLGGGDPSPAGPFLQRPVTARFHAYSTPLPEWHEPGRAQKVAATSWQGAHMTSAPFGAFRRTGPVNRVRLLPTENLLACLAHRFGHPAHRWFPSENNESRGVCSAYRTACAPSLGVGMAHHI
jgi:hypothetical protein